MKKSEKKYYLEKEYEAYYSGWNGIEIKAIEYGIIDHVIFVSDAWYGHRKVHRAKIHYGKRPYFIHAGHRIAFDDCIRRGI